MLMWNGALRVGLCCIGQMRRHNLCVNPLEEERHGRRCSAMALHRSHPPGLSAVVARGKRPFAAIWHGQSFLEGCPSTNTHVWAPLLRISIVTSFSQHCSSHCAKLFHDREGEKSVTSLSDRWSPILWSSAPRGPEPSAPGSAAVPGLVPTHSAFISLTTSTHGPFMEEPDERRRPDITQPALPAALASHRPHGAWLDLREDRFSGFKAFSPRGCPEALGVLSRGFHHQVHPLLFCQTTASCSDSHARLVRCLTHARAHKRTHAVISRSEEKRMTLLTDFMAAAMSSYRSACSASRAFCTSCSRSTMFAVCVCVGCVGVYR